MDFYFYIDFGSGYTLLDVYDLDINLGFSVDENINPGVKRKSVNGSFKIIDTQYTSAYTYFVTNGSVNAPFRIYENGVLGVGTLKFQGFANVNDEFNERESLVTFNAFTVNDAYQPVLAVWNDDSQIVESMGFSGGFREFYSQGQNTNCSVLQAYSGTTWTKTGNALSLGDVGRVAIDNTGTGVTIYDNLTKTLNRYTYSAPNWIGATLGTTLDLTASLGNLLGNGAIAAISSTQIAFVEDGYNQLSFITMTTGTWTINNTYSIEDISKPSIAFLDSVNGYIAIVDNGTKVLRAYSTSTGLPIGNTLSIGDIINPDICTLDAANARIALVDAKTNTLRVYEFDGSDFTELNANQKLGTMYEPKMTQETTNAITLIDAIGGFMARYSLSGTTWSQTGSNTTISGGYMGASGYDGTVIGVVQSDCLALETTRTPSYYELVNEVLSDLSLGLSIPASGNGATFDLDKIYIGELSNLKERTSDPTQINYSKFKLKDLLELAEMFQNYWYIDGSDIKFKQPNTFSAVGTNFSIQTLNRAGIYVKDENNQLRFNENFNISKERILFNNERNIEFVGTPIDYNRDNDNEVSYSFPYTADFNFIVDFLTGKETGLNMSGFFIAYVELDSDSGYGVLSDTGIIGSSDTRNNYLSKSQIMESFWKDYRYTIEANFDMNGASVAPQDTCRPMISYPPLQLDYDDLSLTEFPSSVGSLTWDVGKVGYISEFFVNLYTKQLSINTGKLDL